MRSDFGDIRFSDENETIEYPYHLLSKTDGVSATFEFKVPPFNANENFNIKIHTGNPEASDISNPNSVYTIFRKGNVIDGWQILVGTVTIEDGAIKLTSTVNTLIIPDIILSQNYKIKCDTNIYRGALTTYRAGGILFSRINTSEGYFTSRMANNTEHAMRITSGRDTDPTYSILAYTGFVAHDQNKFYSEEVCVDNNKNVKYYLENELIHSLQIGTIGAGNIGISGQGNKYKNFRVMPYINPEPTLNAIPNEWTVK